MFRLALSRASSGAAALARMPQRRTLASSTLCVKGLSMDTTEENLRELTEEFGPVYSVNLMTPRPGDFYLMGFVRYYNGELADTIEGLASLPPPTNEEISRAVECTESAIQALDGKVVNGLTLKAAPSDRDMPDRIQFHARNQLRRERDPEFKRTGEAMRSRVAQGSNTSKTAGGYPQGYKDGFRDGLAEANK